jgi:hypothetical protein
VRGLDGGGLRGLLLLVLHDGLDLGHARAAQLTGQARPHTADGLHAACQVVPPGFDPKATWFGIR